MVKRGFYGFLSGGGKFFDGGRYAGVNNYFLRGENMATRRGNGEIASPNRPRDW